MAITIDTNLLKKTTLSNGYIVVHIQSFGTLFVTIIKDFAFYDERTKTKNKKD